MTTLFYKIPPNPWSPSAPPEAGKLPLPKGGIMPLFGKVGTTRNREGEGEIFSLMSYENLNKYIIMLSCCQTEIHDHSP